MFKLTNQFKQVTMAAALGFAFSAPAALATTDDIDVDHNSSIAVEANTGLETAEAARELQEMGRGIGETARDSASELRQSMGDLVRQEVGATLDVAVSAEVAGQVGASISENARNTVRESVRDNIRDNTRPIPVRGRGGE